MNRALPFVIGVVLLLAPGCFVSRSTVNEPLARPELERFVPGTTTAKEVVEALGAPNEVVQLGNRTAYRYDFSVAKNAGFSIIIVTFLNNDLRSDRVWLFFDSKDVLTHAGSTFQSRDAEFAMPWQEIHED